MTSSPWTYDDTPGARPDGDVTLMEGTTFCISDAHGDIGAHHARGLFVRDTRVLSTWRLELAGRRLEPLRVHHGTPFGATFLLLAPSPDGDPGAGDAATDVLVMRERFVGDGLREEVTLRNAGGRPARLVLEVLVGADFADLFEVKDARALTTGKVRVHRDGELELSTVRDGGEYAVSVLVRDGECGHGDLLRWEVELAPHGAWSTSLQVVPSLRGRRLVPHHQPGVPAEHTEPARRHRSFRAGAPRLTTADRSLTDVLARSIDDLATLRIFDPDRPEQPVIAAGAPWFMALFGRDSLITSLMLLPVDSGLALGTLSALGSRLGVHHDEVTEEQPGRVPHEVRFGPAGSLALDGRQTYFGTADATPLFALAVGELARWEPSLVGPDLVAAADRALDWVRGPGDRDGDGFVEYERATDRGLANQGWKDSWDGISFADGTLPRAPIALAEVQGYAYAAYLARADLADAAGDGDTAAHWRQCAADLKLRFDEAFWLPDRGWYAVGLDRDKRPIDALTSNIGHCLWTGIVADEHADEVAGHLTSPAMSTGWGIRTLAEGMGAYNPMSYHNGSVWPHDTALCLAGLARYGFAEEAKDVALALLEAATAFGGRLPELFSGFARDDAPVPVPYPAACSPQAWASAAPFQLLSSLLGLSAGTDGLECAPDVPGRLLPLHLGNVSCRGGRYDIDVDDRGWQVRPRTSTDTGGTT